MVRNVLALTIKIQIEFHLSLSIENKVHSRHQREILRTILVLNMLDFKNCNKLLHIPYSQFCEYPGPST